jgi:TetR/AcrR family transcriptional regulator, lmrAB and yxaGH operons repressor
MSAKPKHRHAIVDTAVRLFRQKGYSGTGLSEIVEASAAPKGSLYHYFPGGKAAIAEEAVREAGRRVAKTIRELAAGRRSTGELLIAHAGLLSKWMEQSGFRDGCPITTVLLEMAPDDAAITEAGREAYAARLEAVRERLRLDGVPPARAERLATLCTSALQGALIQARVERSGEPILAAAAELDLLLRGLVSGGEAAKGGRRQA